MGIFLSFVLVATSIVVWAVNWIGLPGNWGVLVLAVAYDLVTPERWLFPLGWPIVIALLVLAILGEVLEFFAGVAGSSSVGGSRRAGWYALVGSIVGGIGGAFLALPIPVIGSMIAAVLGSVLGALVGGVWGEREAGKDLSQSVKVGSAAAVGRLLGTLGKSLIGAIMLAVLIVGLLF